MQTSLNPLVTNLISGDKLASTLTFGQFVKGQSLLSLAPIIAAWVPLQLFLHLTLAGNRCLSFMQL